jgi:hypothetical protein
MTIFWTPLKRHITIVYPVYDKMYLKWALFPFFTSQPMPENPDNPLILVPVENTPKYRSICHNTEGMRPT